MARHVPSQVGNETSEDFETIFHRVIHMYQSINSVFRIATHPSYKLQSIRQYTVVLADFKTRTRLVLTNNLFCVSVVCRKLNIINSKNSPKKKKKHQKIKRTYVVVRDVITVNWNRRSERQLISLKVQLKFK